ncbi:unnamed protein product [Amoebophrya sp. A25]|nr:unnamed protein product [Amoebophrya sp. A25]|eukprot:GSA25T00021083001.1
MPPKATATAMKTVKAEPERAPYPPDCLQGRWVTDYDALVSVTQTSVYFDGVKNDKSVTCGKNGVLRWCGWELVRACPTTDALLWREKQTKKQAAAAGGYSYVLWEPIVPNQRTPLVIEGGLMASWRAREKKSRAYHQNLDEDTTARLLVEVAGPDCGGVGGAASSSSSTSTRGVEQAKRSSSKANGNSKQLPQEHIDKVEDDDYDHGHDLKKRRRSGSSASSSAAHERGDGAARTGGGSTASSLVEALHQQHVHLHRRPFYDYISGGLLPAVHRGLRFRSETKRDLAVIAGLRQAKELAKSCSSASSSSSSENEQLLAHETKLLDAVIADRSKRVDAAAGAQQSAGSSRRSSFAAGGGAAFVDDDGEGNSSRGSPRPLDYYSPALLADHFIEDPSHQPGGPRGIGEGGASSSTCSKNLNHGTTNNRSTTTSSHSTTANASPSAVLHLVSNSKTIASKPSQLQHSQLPPRLVPRTERLARVLERIRNGPIDHPSLYKVENILTTAQRASSAAAQPRLFGRPAAAAQSRVKNYTSSSRSGGAGSGAENGAISSSSSRNSSGIHGNAILNGNGNHDLHDPFDIEDELLVCASKGIHDAIDCRQFTPRQLQQLQLQSHDRQFQNASHLLKHTFETEDLLEDDYEMFVLRHAHSDQVLACCTLQVENEKRVILFFTVKPQHRKAGYSARFIQLLMRECGSKGRLFTVVHVGADKKEEPLANFWRGQGFTIENAEDAPETPFKNCIVLELDRSKFRQHEKNAASSDE